MAYTLQPTSIPIPSFSGENYDYWSIKMSTYFRSQDLWDIVEDGFTTPEDTSTVTPAQKKELKDNMIKDSKALIILQQAMSESIFPRIMGAKSAKEAWSILKEEFQGSEKVRLIKLQTLRREFELLNMKDSETIKDYYSKIKGIINQMRAYGENILDKRIVEKILISISRKYDSIVTTIEQTKDLSTLSVTELVGSLEANEQRISRLDEGSLESAFQSNLKLRSQNKGYKKKINNVEDSTNKEKPRRNNCPPCGICDRKNHLEKDCWFRGKPYCKHCKRMGHTDQNCRNKRQH